MIFTLNVWVLGKFIGKFKNLCKALLWYAKVQPKPYVEIPWNPVHICCLSLHWALSNCCDPCGSAFHAFMIKIHVHAIHTLLSFYEKLALYHPSIPQNKILHNMCWSFSLQILLQKRYWLSKKIWTHEGPRKKKKRKEEIAMFSKDFAKGERSYKRSFH